MPLTDAEFRQATEAGRELLENTPHVVTAAREGGAIVITFANRMVLTVPIDTIQELAPHVDNHAALDHVEIDGAGLGLYWPTLDAGLYIPSLMQGHTGTRAWMAKMLGAAGGSVTSPAKTASSRENGRKGGRPRKDAAA